MKVSKSFILLILGVFVLGVALFMIGGTLIGWDVLGWFKSPMALLIYFVVALLGITIIVWWWKDRTKL